VAGATVARFELWHIFNGALGDALSGLLTEFQAQQPSIGVDATYVPYDAMLQTLLSAISAGTPPAAAVLEMTLMARLAAENALAPVESLLTATGAATLKDSLVPSIRDANSVGGALCTVPLGYNSNQLYYNPDLLQRASLDPEHDLPASWDALVEVAPRLTVNRTADQQADVGATGFRRGRHGFSRSASGRVEQSYSIRPASRRCSIRPRAGPRSTTTGACRRAAER
jgi:ABC-type glycerol-3-phosphate transport system substrate-binding protein